MEFGVFSNGFRPHIVSGNSYDRIFANRSG